MGTHPYQLQSHSHPKRCPKPCSDLDPADSGTRLQISFSPACHFLWTPIICSMKCCVLIDIGRSWLKFISHSLLLLQRNKGFFFNPKNRKPSYLCGVKHETGSLFEKQHLMFPLFNPNSWAFLYHAVPVPLLWDSVMSGAADRWQIAVGRVVLTLTKFLSLQWGEKSLCVKEGASICLDSLLLSYGRDLFQGKVGLSIPSRAPSGTQPRPLQPSAHL